MNTTERAPEFQVALRDGTKARVDLVGSFQMCVGGDHFKFAVHHPIRGFDHLVISEWKSGIEVMRVSHDEYRWSGTEQPSDADRAERALKSLLLLGRDANLVRDILRGASHEILRSNTSA